MAKKKKKKEPLIKEPPLQRPEIVLPQQLANSNARLVKLGYAKAVKVNSLGQVIEMHVDIESIARFMADVAEKFTGLGNGSI